MDSLVSSLRFTIRSTPLQKNALCTTQIIHKAFMTLHRPAPGRCAKSYGFILSENCINIKNDLKIR